MPRPKSVAPLPGDLKFETALLELETLLQVMEGGKLELEASIDAYQRGMALLAHCRGQLAAAEQKIQIMEAGQAKDWNPEEARS
ncbi:MAG: exodeoxyribonuclease VII small subunit [Zoogloeaceae bacterium]|nr:exodeoxyribonuclease VII small subunit [Zoogloeaceae bacterium]